jgi:hypothetical protein
VVVIVTSVVLFGGNDGGPDASPGTPTPTASAGSGAATAPGTRSAVTGTISDAKAGISYARLGPPWSDADSGWTRPGLFDAGEVSIVQEPFEEYASFNATSLSGVPRPAESAGYTGSQGPFGGRPACHEPDPGRALRLRQEPADALLGRAYGRRAPGLAGEVPARLPRRRGQGLEVLRRHGGHPRVDTGGGRLGELWVSVPDTFTAQGDVDQVLSSVKVT